MSQINGWDVVNEAVRDELDETRLDLIRDMVHCSVRNESLKPSLALAEKKRDRMVERYFSIPLDEREPATLESSKDLNGYLRAVGMMLSFRDFNE